MLGNDLVLCALLFVVVIGTGCGRQIMQDEATNTIVSTKDAVDDFWEQNFGKGGVLMKFNKGKTVLYGIGKGRNIHHTIDVFLTESIIFDDFDEFCVAFSRRPENVHFAVDAEVYYEFSGAYSPSLFTEFEKSKFLIKENQ